MTKRIWPTDEELLHFDPFSEDRDVRIECRRIKRVVIRIDRLCAAGFLIEDMHDSHIVKAGTPMVRESAKVDGEFGSSYQCFDCLRKLYQANYSEA